MLLQLKLFFLLLSLVLAKECPRTTFKNSKVKINDVDVTVTGCITAQRLNSLNITYDETKTYRIVVEGNSFANINQGCVTNFPADLTIDFHNNFIDGIKTKAFYNLPKLSVIFFENCGIRTIETDAFLDLPSLTAVYFKFNKLRTIPPSTFNNLPLMKTMFVQFSQLSAFQTDWFKDTPSLSQISLSHNLLGRIPASTFNGLTNLEQLNLRVNGLQRLDEGAFLGLPKLKYLDLTGNNLTYVSEKVLEDLEESLVQLNLYGNPMQCSCYEKLVRWSYDNNIADPFSTTDSWRDCFGENPVCISGENSTVTECVEDPDEGFEKELNRLFYEQFRNRHCFY